MVTDACDLAEKYRTECEMLKDEVELLNREADWLIRTALCTTYEIAPQKSLAWWRNEARKAALRGN